MTDKSKVEYDIDTLILHLIGRGEGYALERLKRETYEMDTYLTNLEIQEQDGLTGGTIFPRVKLLVDHLKNALDWNRNALQAESNHAAHLQGKFSLGQAREMSAERLRDRLRASHEALLQIQSNVLTPDQIKTLARETTAENSEELRKVPIEEQTKSTWEHRPPTEKERQQATQKVQKKMQKQIEELQEIPGPEILGEEGEHLYRRVVRDEQRRSGAAPDNW